MATVTASDPTSFSSPLPFPSQWTAADLVAHLGGIPLERIRMFPPPGQATPDDVEAIQAHEDRLCELIDGILVEKTMGWLESRLAIEIAVMLSEFLKTQDLGVVTGADGTIRLYGNQVRIPDVSFFLWQRFPNRKLPRESSPLLPPDLAIEVLSKSNTNREMDRKLKEYFAAGAQLVWYIDPADRSAKAFTAPDQFEVLRGSQLLTGGNVLPGFAVSIDELFARAGAGS